MTYRRITGPTSGTPKVPRRHDLELVAANCNGPCEIAGHFLGGVPRDQIRIKLEGPTITRSTPATLTPDNEDKRP